MEPDNATLLRTFDYIAAIIYGIVAAVFAGFATPDGWPMIPAMFLGMILGMGVVLPLILLFSTVFGGLQLVMLGMIVGMTVGMGAGMTKGKTLLWLATYGAISGLAIQLTVHLYDRQLHGEVNLLEEEQA